MRAVEETLRYLQPPWDEQEPGLCEWLGKVYQVQSAVESILRSQQDESFVQEKRFSTYKYFRITVCDMHNLQSYRYQWYSIIVIRMFVENIILRCGSKQMVMYGKRLEKVSTDEKTMITEHLGVVGC